LNAVITSRMSVVCTESPSLDQFGYRLFSSDGLLHEDTVTVRRARIFAAELVGSPYRAVITIRLSSDAKVALAGFAQASGFFI
jgi:hypothetical protein